jgi:hypothetical protein
MCFFQFYILYIVYTVRRRVDYRAKNDPGYPCMHPSIPKDELTSSTPSV